jgi:hypothetical protein
MSSGRIAQHRNYGDIMARHERDVRIKRVLRIFTYFLIAAAIVILFFMVKRIETKSTPKERPTQSSVYLSHPNKV